jgi:GT2 family glycosyltransferase
MPLIYGDQDELGPDGARQAPWLKPEWDRELFLAQDFVSSACAIPLSQAQGVRVGGCRDGDPLFGLLVDLTANPDLAVRHVPAVTTYAAPGSWRRGGAARQAELALRLAVSGCKVEPGPFGTTSLAWPVPQAPAGRLPVVSIIVPTRDRVDLLGPCLDSLLGQTSWPAFEVLVVDNGSVEPQTLQYFQRLASDPRVRVLTFDQPYNFSAINNFAAQAAAGEYLCLLNNDTEVIDGEWLTELMRYALRPDCGAVGARLLYPDQSIQHAGVVVGLGGAAGHAHRGLPASQPGYFARAYAAHRATAVTAACLVVRKDRFLAVGGLDAEGLAIAYNDIDLCLKLRGTGCHNYYAPRAVLIHHESKSRGLDLSPQHLARYQAELAVFQERWNTVGYDDPLHHRWLDRSAETYRLSLGESWS